MIRQRLSDQRTWGMIGGLYLALGLFIPWSVYLMPWVCDSRHNCPEFANLYLPRAMSGLAYLMMLDPAGLPHFTVIALINLLPVGVGVVALAFNGWGQHAPVHQALVRLYLGLVVILVLTAVFKGWIFVNTFPSLQGNEMANSLSVLLMILSSVVVWRNARWLMAKAVAQANARL